MCFDFLVLKFVSLVIWRVSDMSVEWTSEFAGESINDAGGGGGGGKSRSVKHNPAHAAVTSPAGISFSPARIRPSIVGRP